MDALRLTKVLLELHGQSHVLGFRAMQRVALELLRTVVPSEGSRLAIVIADRQHDSHGIGATSATHSLYVRHEDRQLAIVRDTPFSDDDRAAIDLLLPHIVAATRHAHVLELRAMARYEGQGFLAAIAPDAPVILEAEPGVAEMFRAEWPQWRGPGLPAWLHIEHYIGRRIVVTIDTSDDAGLRLLLVRHRVAADALTEREREVAEAFANGESHREIGDRLQISPATVRRHLANLYEKLGVSSKAELDRMLRGV